MNDNINNVVGEFTESNPPNHAGAPKHRARRTDQAKALSKFVNWFDKCEQHWFEVRDSNEFYELQEIVDYARAALCEIGR